MGFCYEFLPWVQPEVVGFAVAYAEKEVMVELLESNGETKRQKLERE